MAGRIPQPFIDELLDRTDIVEVVSARVPLRKSGKNYSACCPFHEEKTPSFTVSPDKQFYYCFGCRASGNAVGFVMEFDRIDFPAAVEQLAQLASMEVPREETQESRFDQQRKALFGVLEQANEFYQAQLHQHAGSASAVAYLKQRGLSGDISRRFGIGFAPPGWDNLLKQLGIDAQRIEQLTLAGLLVDRPEENKRYDRFRHRIMFPIRDARGRVIGFGGRVLGDDTPKYLNSPETPVYHKGRELYGLYEANQAMSDLTHLLVVEGYMDVIVLAQHGIENAVATLGTALTPEHLEKIFRHTTDVVFCFDGDNAGRSAARRALDVCLPAMTDGRSARFLFLPQGEDPDTLVRHLGKSEFSRLVDNAMPLVEFLLQTAGDGIDLESLDGKARLSQKALPLIQRLPNGVFQELVYQELARRTGIARTTLQALLNPPSAEPEPHEYESLATPAPDIYGAEPGEHDAGGWPDSDDYWQSLAPASSQQPTGPHRSASSAPATDRATHRATDRKGRRPDKPSTSGRPPLTVRLSLAETLIALLLNHPELAQHVPSAAELRDDFALLELDDIELLIDLVQLLQKHPDYSLNHILGYWHGVYGSEKGERLSAIAATDLLHAVAERNDIEEVEGCLQRLRQHARKDRLRQLQHKLQQGSWAQLSDTDRQELRELMLELGNPRGHA